jgi:hypothetical protein
MQAETEVQMSEPAETGPVPGNPHVMSEWHSHPRLPRFGDAVHTWNPVRRVKLTPITAYTNSCRISATGEG